MKTEILFVNSFKEEMTFSDFLNQLMEHPTIKRDFMIARMGPENIRGFLKEYISENGISSLFDYHITCDSIMHQGIKVDEIEELVLGFIRKLKGVRNLVITDPFLYTDDIDCVSLFEKIILEISGNIESVTFCINNKRKNQGAEMHGVLKKINPKTEIKEIVTDEIHDRYWLDTDNKKGVVMGTSLNGIGKKIALIDHLKQSDVNELIEAINELVKTN